MHTIPLFILVCFLLSGTIDIDLLSIPDAKKTASECSLQQLDPTHKKINLFEKKRLKGWWPVFEQTDPETKELTVRRTWLNVCINHSYRHIKGTARYVIRHNTLRAQNGALSLARRRFAG